MFVRLARPLIHLAPANLFPVTRAVGAVGTIKLTSRFREAGGHSRHSRAPHFHEPARIDSPRPNEYVVLMLPGFVDLPRAPFRVLPPGVFWATIAEIETRFAITEHRMLLFEGFLAVTEVLRAAGCRTVYLDGSFVTEKPHPNDFDGCWDPVGVVGALLDPVLLDFSNKRAAQKSKYKGEMFISTQTNGPLGTFLDFFQSEKVSGQPKGVVGLRLSNGEVL